ncbi:MAG: cysteine--tRNA ligase [Patescibacteria group bacterium]
MKINLYNTYSRNKEEFIPLNGPEVTIYTCGPTVYNFAHIGNLRAYVFADILRKILKYADYQVKQVINVTDVGHLTSDEDQGEDKIEKSAKEIGKTPDEIADYYLKAFIEDMVNLHIEKPEFMPKATENIKEMIDIIEKLLENGHAYKTNSGIYYDITKFADYGKLARLDMENMQFGKRIELEGDKKHPSDFALWVLNKPEHLMKWDSPWGKGYPGWHIECSAMAMKYLGETIDIHTGGVDHIPVHHTNEIAQSEGATGKKFVRFWMHSEFLNITGEKMAKSSGEFLTLEELIKKGYDPISYRYFLMTNHYRSKIEFSWEKLDAAQKTLQKIRLLPSLGGADEDICEKINDAIGDDLDIPRMISLLHQSGDKDLWIKYDDILGLGWNTEIPEEVEDLAKERIDARNNKNFEEADRLRQKIEDMGYLVQDSSEGYKIVKK